MCIPARSRTDEYRGKNERQKERERGKNKKEKKKDRGDRKSMKNQEGIKREELVIDGRIEFHIDSIRGRKENSASKMEMVILKADSRYLEVSYVMMHDDSRCIENMFVR